LFEVTAMTVRSGRVVIRTASLDDVEPVRALLGAVWRATYEPLIGRERVEADHAAWHAAGVLAGQVNETLSSFLVVQDGPEEIVGHAFVSAAHPPVLHVARLYVSPAYQRRGIGTALMQEMLAPSSARDDSPRVSAEGQ
jgi:predicted N-acetyltransferase YhbS